MPHKIVFRFSTPSGAYYDVTSEGFIIRLDQKDFQPSGQWRFVGMVHTKRTTEFIPFADIVRMTSDGTLPELKFKTSGNPQYTVVDYDHGTQRVWGNTKYHGIRLIWKSDEVRQ